MSVPFGERGGVIRGCLDLACGRFPRFVFGGGIGHLLPVFHFHDESRATLEPQLQYLAENGYRTVIADDIGAFVRGTTRLPNRAVALCFDDAWASVWTTAAPLLKRYALRAIVYAIPGRIGDADERRPQQPIAGAAGPPFVTWQELRELDSEGTIDAQSHTLTHAMVFTGHAVTAFVEPGYEQTPVLARPAVDRTPCRPSDGAAPLMNFLSPSELGAPLYRPRSRMSDGPRVKHSPAAHDACVRLVASEGGRAFFTSPRWRSRLTAVVFEHDLAATPERDDEQQRAIERELDEARAELRQKLAKDHVDHVCLPWGVSGRGTALALKRLGFQTAIANRLTGVFAVRPGDDPHWLKRLPNRYIYRLPGRGRRWWFRQSA